MTSLQKALKSYLARRDGNESPAGQFRGGQWLPDQAETRPCCSGVKGCLWEDALRRHCRSLRHVAALHGVEEKALRQALRRRGAQEGQYYFVAAAGPRLVAVGSDVEMRIGRKVVGVGTSARAFESAKEAEMSALGHGAKEGVILRVEVTGGRLGPTGSLAFDQATPVEVVREFGKD